MFGLAESHKQGEYLTDFVDVTKKRYMASSEENDKLHEEIQSCHIFQYVWNMLRNHFWIITNGSVIIARCGVVGSHCSPFRLGGFSHNTGHFLEMLFMASKQQVGRHSNLEMHLCWNLVAWLSLNCGLMEAENRSIILMFIKEQIKIHYQK